MKGSTRTRVGGRSARIQEAVHKAVDDLSHQFDRAELTISMIAERAGVPPSTVYRRWGGLLELLADVAVNRLRPAAQPIDTGSAEGDLLAWSEQYLEEMSSMVGRTMIRDVVSDALDSDSAAKCISYVEDHLALISDRATKRGEEPLNMEAAMDLIVAPIIFHTLFGGDLTTATSIKLVKRFIENRAA